MSFINNLSAIIPASEIASKNNLSYLSAATAVARAERPKFNFLNFSDPEGRLQPFLSMLNGALVGVEIEKAPGVFQTMYLPVMDRDNRAMDFGAITVSDVNNSRQRCLVKAVAAVTGVGMSLFMGCDGDGAKAAKLLKVVPTTDLSDIEPVVATLADGGAPYIEWNYGLAAANTVDHAFAWRVEMFDGLPYREVLGSLQVEVTTVFQGKSLTLALPVMDAAFNPIPIAQATVFDWNKTMMRALTKCIAFNTGYGLSIYADETEAKADAAARGARSARKGRDKEPSKTTPAATPSPSPASEKAQVDSAEAAAPAAQEPEAAAPVAAQEAQVDDAAVKGAPATDAVSETAAAAEVKKDETPAPAAAPATATPTVESTLLPARQVEVDRFKGVMAKRRSVNGIDGLLSLFQALSASTVFADPDKPDCFATLVAGIVFDIEDLAKKDAEAGFSHVPALLDNIGQHDVAQMFSPDTRHLVALRLTTLAFQAAVSKGDDKALTDASEMLVKAGIAEDVAHVFNLSQEADLPQETKDLLAAVLDAQAA